MCYLLRVTIKSWKAMHRISVNRVLAVPMGIRKQKNKLPWVATVGCPVLFISLMIDGL